MMKKLFVIAIAVVAISFMSCGSKTEKAEKEISAACACDSCQCDSCKGDSCNCAGQVDSTAVEETAKEDGVLESVNGAMNKAQTKAKGKSGRGACRHAGCGCPAYRMAWDGSGGKCVCGHWDYVHN